MSRTPVSFETQMLVAGLLATGRSQIEAAKEAGVSRSTVSRLLERESFKAEVERRRDLKQPVSEELLAAVKGDTASDWVNTIKSHIEAVEKAATLSQACGFNALTKGMRRLKDLPDESLKPSDAIALIKAGQDLLSASFDWKAEAIGLHEIAERVANAQET